MSRLMPRDSEDQRRSRLATKRHKKHKREPCGSLLCFLWLIFLLLGRTAAASTAAATRGTAACATAASTGTEGARRRIGTRITVFGKAAAAFRIEDRILFTLDAGGFGLLVAGGSAFETCGHVH